MPKRYDYLFFLRNKLKEQDCGNFLFIWRKKEELNLKTAPKVEL